MVIRDFFILLIKLFGLFSLIKGLSLLSISLGRFDIIVLMSVIIGAGVIVGLFWLLISRADKLVDFLKLENGFSEKRIELGNVKPSDIIKLGTFIIGGLLVINNIPEFLSNAYWAFKGNISGDEFISSNRIKLTVSGLNILLGYLLATNYAFVSSIINEKKVQE
ncbi:MAG: hypothetical protein K8H85_09640 [Cyclobacteriaceae bacterium]|nr:hypothetical protein [Cyclobacteriaceae bacterium]